MRRNNMRRILYHRGLARARFGTHVDWRRCFAEPVAVAITDGVSGRSSIALLDKGRARARAMPKDVPATYVYIILQHWLFFLAAL